jgi:cation diffusion facilitator CzcD-associated flavoprotein CzcO
MFTLGYAFRPWDGDKAIADGDSILAYIKDTAAEAGIDGRVRFRHRVVQAAWSSDEARWHITAQRIDTGEVVEVTCGFVFCCTGYYRYDHGYLPDFVGMDRFGGTIVHPQAWPSDLSHNGQRVIVIGSGATAVTLVPALAAAAAHVTMVQRSPSYVASMPARDPIADALRRALPRRYSGPVIKWFKALTTQGFYRLSRSRPELVKRLLRRMADEHQLLGRGLRDQGVPAVSQGGRRGSRDQPVERVRADQRARAGRLQRRQVRGARVDRRAADGTRDGPLRGLVHDRAPRRRQDQHRPERTGRPQRGGHPQPSRRCRRRLRQAGPHEPRERGAPDPPGRHPKTAGASWSGRTRR